MPPRRVEDVDQETIDALNRGERETRDLVESFTIDAALLMRAAAPGLPDAAIDAMRAGADVAYTKRMRLAGLILLEHLGLDGVRTLVAHRSDTVRGWVCFALGAASDGDLDAALEAIRPLADDPHFGVREWAWLAVRDGIVADPARSIELLTRWAREPSENLRRFASEATRPRGVWSAHIPLLKSSPGEALPILEPLRADPSRYVQNSVGNWINDAAKSAPAWVRDLCARWRRESETRETAYICKRGERSLGG